MAVTSGSGTRELDQTPTWAVAGVCLVIIVISIALEKILHKVGMWFKKKRKEALFEALEKVKAELMILGFISLLLTFGQNYIGKICVPYKVADTMLPCPATDKISTTGRKLLWYDHRVLAAGVSGTACKPGKFPLITVNGLHQLHILIFFLAVFHVIYTALMMALGRLKIRRWKRWEQETTSLQFSVDRSRLRLTHETSFVRGHTSFWTTIHPVLFYIGCFFKQFDRSVNKSDYLTLRNGFIHVHLAPGNKFNFQKYVKRSLEDDFKTIVGVSPVLWASFVTFLLLNVYGWQALFWASLIPPFVGFSSEIILAVGTKLQAILTSMALEITDKQSVVEGIPLVKGSDKYFWFGRPQLVLNLMHFALFQNAFQITYFLWIWYSFGLQSCFHDNFKLVIVKIALGFVVLFFCSYITLPLYALTSQMGSHMKTSIFNQQISQALRNWHKAAKKKHDNEGGKSPMHITLGKSPPAASVSSKSPSSREDTIHQYSIHSISYEDRETFDYEAPPSNLIVRVDNDNLETKTSAPSYAGEGSLKKCVSLFSKSSVPMN